MSEKKINLEKIIHNSIVNDLILKGVESGQARGIANKIISKDWYVKEAMKEFGKQLLELAAENATCYDPHEGTGEWEIDKQSILDTINQVI